MPGRMTFENIPGTDPGTITDVSRLQPGFIAIASLVVPGEAAAAFRADTGRGIGRRRMTEEGPIAHVTDPEYTNVICEPMGYSVAWREPEERGGVTYAGFRFAEANLFTLSNGGRLLADTRSYGLNNTAILMPIASERARYEGGPEAINRIANSLEEARLVVAGIGAYMGLEEGDAQLLARVVLDFEKLHEGGVPATGNPS